MSVHHGRFCWYELLTSDVAAAEAFYGRVVGWTTRDSGVPGMAYTLFAAADGIPAAGMLALSAEMTAAGARPGWTGVVAVDDVDRVAAEFAEGGGRVQHGPADIPGVGRFAVVADPQGAVLSLLQPSAQGEPPPAGAPGHGAWRELLAADWTGVFPFYADRFGWTKAEPFDMGPMGVYQLVAQGGATFGGMMTKPASVPAPFWVYYFAVDSIESATGRVREAGGQVVNGPHEVPGGSWIVQALDPQGVMFALNGPR